MGSHFPQRKTKTKPTQTQTLPEAEIYFKWINWAVLQTPNGKKPLFPRGF
jgi:hypothetical protein